MDNHLDTSLPEQTSYFSDSIIRPMRFTDLKQVIDVHLASFPGFFLTFLGRDFLTLLYSQLLTDPFGTVLLADTLGTIDGFVASVLQQSGFYGRLVRQQALDRASDRRFRDQRAGHAARVGSGAQGRHVQDRILVVGRHLRRIEDAADP